MALLQISRGEPVNKKDDSPVLLRVTTDDGHVLIFQADAGDFSRGVALHRPFPVIAVEPVVTRPRAS